MDEKLNEKFWELATSKLHNEADNEETAELNKLLEKEENHDVYMYLKKCRNKMTDLNFSDGCRLSKSWENIIQYFKVKKFKLYLNISKYAALIFFAFLTGSLFNLNLNSLFNHNSPAVAEIKVPLGQMSVITLYDGSKVWLNSGTTLSYAENFGKKVRKVLLKGEAFFEIKKDEVPFKVQLKNSEIEVLGTSFAAISYEDDNFSKVTLVQGSLKVNDLLGREIGRITPDQQLNIPDDISKCSVNKVDIEFYESWVEGKMVFREERLEDISGRLERWYNVDIRFDQSEIGDLRFTGTILKNKPFDQIVKAFGLLLPIEIDYLTKIDEKDVVTISKRI